MASPTWRSADRSLTSAGLPDSANCNVVVGGAAEDCTAPGWRRIVMLKIFHTKNAVFSLTCKTQKTAYS